MSKRNEKHPRGTMSVSAFIADEVVPRPDKANNLFDLRGVGLGWWETHPGSVIAIQGHVFAMIHFHGARSGAHTISLRFETANGELIHRMDVLPPFEVASKDYTRHFSVPLDGIELPIGHHWLWVVVNGGEAQTGISLTVYDATNLPPYVDEG